MIPSGLLNYIKWRHPRVVSHLIHVLSQKIYGSMQNTLTNGVGLTMPLADGKNLQENLSFYLIIFFLLFRRISRSSNSIK